MEDLKLRMYFFVPYNISDKQIGIQAGHSSLRYARKFGAGDENAWVWDFVDNHETWIILDGGTTNNSLEHPGSLQELYRSILDYNNSVKSLNEQIDVVPFYEPDLNDALSAFCFIADERCWTTFEYELYVGGEEGTGPDPSYDFWLNNIVGGKKNNFIRELLTGKKLA